MTDAYVIAIADQVRGQLTLAREFATGADFAADFAAAKDCLNRAREFVNLRDAGERHLPVMDALRDSIRLFAIRVAKLDPAARHHPEARL